MNKHHLPHSKIKKRNYDVLDIYLFINPLDIKCLSYIDKFINYSIPWNHKIYIHVIPYCNLKTVFYYLKQNNLDTSNFELHNKIYNLAYEISLMYKTASCQGKKKAFNFLNNLSKTKPLNQHELTKKDIEQVILESDLEIDSILLDYTSKHTRDCYLQDLKIANQFNIQKTPSIVIFNSRDNDGILLENLTSDQIIPTIDATLSFKYQNETTPY